MRNHLHLSHFRLMLVLRGLYFLSIVSFAMLGRWNVVWFETIVFCGSLFVPWLGQKDDHYYVLDCFIVGTFLLALVPTYFNAWGQIPKDLFHTTFGFDKVFHMAGGACLAMFWAIFTRKEIKHHRFFYAGIIVFALAAGGAWEVFEWFASLLPAPFTIISQGYADSILDLVADTIGAAIVAYVLRKRKYI